MTTIPLVMGSSGGGASTGALALLYILAAAAMVALVSRRLHLGLIPGYLIVGALIGPSAFGLIGGDEGRAAAVDIGELAVILLMFTIGLHMDLDHIRSGMVKILGVGLVSTIASTAVLWPVGLVFGLSVPASLAVAMALAMCSTAVVLGILQRRREVHSLHGRLCIGIALMQDLLAVVVLGVLPGIAVWAHVPGSELQSGAEGGLAAAMDSLPPAVRHLATGAFALGSVGVMLALGRYLLPSMLREASEGPGGPEALLVVSAATAFGAAVLTTVLGFGSSLGAFLAGFLLSNTPFRHQLGGQLSPLRDLFMAVFFTSVGVKINLGSVVELWMPITATVLVVLVFKTLTVGVAVWAGGAAAGTAIAVGFALCQAGEFGLVIISESNRQGILAADQTDAAIAVVVVSLIVAAPLFDFGRRIANRFAWIPPAGWVTSRDLREVAVHDEPAAAKPGEWDGGHVIIAGFGVVGRNLAEHFGARGVPYVVVELNPATVRKQAQLGRRTVFGDVSNPDVLISAGIDKAEAIVLTIPDDEATVRACRQIRELNKGVFIAARTSFLSKAIAATSMGADHVTVEELVTAQDMAKQVVERIAKRAAQRAAGAV